MKIKYILLSLIALFVIEKAFCQESNEDKGKYKKIKLKKYELVPDSAIAVWDLIVSTPSFSKAKKKMELQETVGSNISVTFSCDEEKGIIYVDFDGLSKDIRPILSVSKERGQVIEEQTVRFANNVVNMTKLPPGTYLFTADVDEEISTWEFVKE
ncbi:MAG: hypothetical protein ACK5HT_15815 [Draconibacterium sp.]